ncbi:MAG: DUF4272 domain-containing protein [Candidatus Odinarchaeota archaeon]
MSEIRIRPPEEVVKRVIVLLGIFQAATGREKKEIIDILKSNNLWSDTSEIEKKFLLNHNEDTKFEAIQFGWRSEAVFILLWALKLVGEVKIPEDESNLDLIIDLLKDSEYYRKIDIKKAQLRNSEDILRLLDKIQIINSELRDASINNKKPPYKYHPSIIFEWNYALNWLVKINKDWDDLTTDS